MAYTERQKHQRIKTFPTEKWARHTSLSQQQGQEVQSHPQPEQRTAEPACSTSASIPFSEGWEEKAKPHAGIKKKKKKKSAVSI